MDRDLFAGTGALTRFILRRDRVRLAVWILGIALFVVALVPVFETMFADELERLVMAEMMLNPAMVAIVGPVYGIGDYHTGALFANMMLLFSAVFVAIMNVFLVTRHTRQDEEQGRLEMIRSLPVGRLANLAATLLAALVANGLLVVLIALGLFFAGGTGMAFWGSVLFAKALGMAGLFFAAATALLCQLTANNRTASAFAFALLMALYLLRAAGDIGTEALALASPLGLILRTEVYVNDYWWPIWVMLGICVLVAAAALALCRARDLGQGLLAEKPGKRHAGRLLASPLGLALRLLRVGIPVWIFTILVFAGMYGSIFGDLESFLANNQMLQAIFSQDGALSLTEQFVTMLMSVMSLIAAIPILGFMLRVRGEEKQGHTEHLLGRSVSRAGQFTAYFLPAFLTSLIMPLMIAVGFYSVGSVVMEDIPAFGMFLKAAYVYLPAFWVMLGLAMALTGWLPSLTAIVYAFLGYSFAAVYLGRIAGLPEWVEKLTPFGHIPQVPAEEVEIPVLAALTAIALILGVLGYVGYGKRDMKL